MITKLKRNEHFFVEKNNKVEMSYVWKYSYYS